VRRPAAAEVAQELERVLAAVRREQLMLESSPDAPSVVELLTGERLKASWWTHPGSETAMAVLFRLRDHAEVVRVPLLSRRATWVHRELWPELLAVATAREAWQLDGLSERALALLALADREGVVRTRDLDWQQWPRAGKSARELEDRLLVKGGEEGNPREGPYKVVTAWPVWLAQHGLDDDLPAAQMARNELHRTVGRLNQAWGTKLRLSF